MSTYSLEHINFLKKIKREKFLVYLTQGLIIIVFFLIWEILSRFNIINTFLFSSPSYIISTISNLISTNNFLNHILITLYEIFISCSVSIIIGFLVATLLWWNKFLARVIDPYLTILNSLPKVALGPLIIIWVGASMNSIIVMSLMISLFITIINLYTFFKNTDNNYITLLKSMKASKRQIYKKVIIMANLKNILSVVKINVSMNLIGVIMGELLVSKEGIGYLIMYGSQVFNINLVMTSVFILAIISSLLYYLIEYFEKKVY
ncbi:MAG: ABC transporter permease [Bacilli bacterium]|nr:ABC transporter permease [Bacilli bacterium]